MKGGQLGVILVIKRVVFGVRVIDHPFHRVYIGYESMPGHYCVELGFTNVHEGRLVMWDGREVIYIKYGVNSRPV